MSLEGTPTQPEPKPAPPELCLPCPADRCNEAFDRVIINRLVRGGTKVMWELRDDFNDPRPYEFQLQVGQTKSNEADDWEDVGFPVVNTFIAIDDEQRVFNKYPNRTFYRVVLTTPVSTVTSDPVAGVGTLSKRDFRLGREILRQELVRFRHQAGQKGVLLKRRITGEDCPNCLDFQTQEVLDPSCPDCFGTGKACGYFFPVDCIWSDMDPKAYHTELDAGKGRGTVDDIKVRARMINTWLMGEEDVWVNLATDDRFYVHRIQNIAEIRGVPLVAKVELRPAPYTDVIYTIEIPEVLSGVGII